MITLSLLHAAFWAAGLLLVGAGAYGAYTHRKWSKQYDSLVLRAASYITGLERLYRYPDHEVSDIANKALRGDL